MSLMPDPTFYPSPRMAMQAPPERLAYVALLNVGNDGKRDAMGVIDLDPSSPEYGRLVGQVDFPRGDNELHHFGWNACSACLCPQAAHPHMERRYLVVPGIGSSGIHILDTKPNPRQPKIVKVIEPEEFIKKTGYTSPHTIHCGPDAIYGSALGSASGDGPGGIFLMDANTFELKGQWEQDRGPQQLAYDFWWHLGHDAMVTSEWGTPNVETPCCVTELCFNDGRLVLFYESYDLYWQVNHASDSTRITIPGPESVVVTSPFHQVLGADGPFPSSWRNRLITSTIPYNLHATKIG